MGHLPIPASTFFNDFAFDVLEYTVSDHDSVVGTYRGLPNSDENGDYIGFLVNDHPQVSVGNTICSCNGMDIFKIRNISYDSYNGQQELLKAYY